MYTKKHIVEDYPYGFRLRTKATFSVKFTPKKGFRSVFQTINPKTGVPNKPKLGVYAPLVMVKVNDEGRASFVKFDWYDNKDKDNDNMFVYNNFNLFTLEEIKGLGNILIGHYKADAVSCIVYAGMEKEKVFELFKDAIKVLKEIATTGDNLFDKVIVDWNTLESLRPNNFNPFK